MNFKKIIALILVAVLCLGLFACGNKRNEGTKDPEGTTPPETTKAPATTLAPTTEAPTTEAPTTEAPATEAPATEAPAATEAPTTEAPSTEAPTPNFGDQLSAAMEQLTQFIEAAKGELEAPDSEVVAEIAADIKEAISAAIAFEMTDEIRTQIATGALASAKDALIEAGVTQETLDQLTNEISNAINTIYTINFDVETVETLLTNVRTAIIGMFPADVSPDLSGAFADKQIAALLAYFNPADAEDAKAKLAAMLADAHAALLAELPELDFVNTSVNNLSALISKILAGEITEEEALTLFKDFESAIYALLAENGITSEVIDQTVAEIRAGLTQLLELSIPKAEIEAEFDSAHATIDELKKAFFSVIGENDTYTLTGILAALSAVEVSTPESGISTLTPAELEAQIKAVIDQIIAFEMTDEIRLNIAKSYLESVKYTLMSAGITAEAVDTIFAEINSIVDMIYAEDFESNFIEGILSELHGAFTALYIENIGESADDAKLYADAQIDAILAVFHPTDRAQAIAALEEIIREAKTAVLEAGLSADVVKSYVAMAKDLVGKILNDGFTDEELIGFVTAFEQSIYATLEQAGITAEMLVSAREQFNAILATLRDAELCAEDIDSVFAVAHAVVDLYETMFYTVFGAGSDGVYNVIDMFAAYIAMNVAVRAPEVEVVTPAIPA